MQSSRLPSRTTYRSVRYCTSRQQNVRTADASSMPKFRIKKNTALESTMMKTGEFEQQMSKTIEVTTSNHDDPQYLRSFLSMMDSERHSTIEERRRFEVRPLKFKILNFQELEGSEFNQLDPFQRHMNAVNTLAKKAKQELQSQREDVGLLRGELANLKKKIDSELEGASNNAKSQLSKFKSLLTQNQTKQQQIKLRFKRDVAKLQIEHDSDCQEFQSILGQNIELQKTIFHCEPYELERNQEWEDEMLGVSDGALC